jgi:hypothetical protein
VGFADRWHPKAIIKEAHVPAWSPDGRQLAYIKNRTVWITSMPPSGSPRRVYRIPQHFIVGKDSSSDLGSIELKTGLSWHPGSNRLAISLYTDYEIQPKAKDLRSNADPFQLPLSTIWLEEVTDRSKSGLENRFVPWLEPKMRGKEGLQSAAFPAWAPSGKKMAFARGGDLHLAELEDISHVKEETYYPPLWSEEELDRIFSGGGSGGTDLMAYCGMSWSSDEKLLACYVRRWNGTGAEWISFYDVAKKTILPIDISSGRHPSFIPNTSSLVYSESPAGQEGLYRFDMKTKKSTLLVKDASYPVCNPNSKAWLP